MGGVVAETDEDLDVVSGGNVVAVLEEGELEF